MCDECVECFKIGICVVGPFEIELFVVGRFVMGLFLRASPTVERDGKDGDGGARIGGKWEWLYLR